MILSKHQRGPKRRLAEQWLLAALAGVLFISLGYILLAYRPAAGEVTPPADLIWCDAERVQGKHFIRGDWRFTKGEYQSRERARSGWYSCRVPAGEGVQYGFAYRLQGAKPGEVYQATVWRYTTPQRDGKLAVRGMDAPDYYFETEEVRQRDDQGWEQLQINFHVPYDKDPGEINIYTYTNGYQPIFFDDLRIKKIAVWDSAVFQPEILPLELSARARRQLEGKRQEAIRDGLLLTDSDDWVNGQISGGRQEDPIPVRLRLKGDWLDHLSGDKWSFRIKVRDPYHWRQLKTFNIHTPAARYHLHEWLLHSLWQREDVLTTRYDLVEVHLDGESLGIYAYEEHFTKQLIEAHRRREGPILKLSEDGLWVSYQRQLAEHGFVVPGSGHSAAAMENADVLAFEEDELLADSLMLRQYRQARRLLRAFVEGSLPADRVFDLERMAAYYAACDVMNAYHGIIWHNQRFYYNPVADRLEPIGYDGFGGPPTTNYTILAEGALDPQSLMSNTLVQKLLQDENFTTLYVQRLYQYSSRTYLDDWLGEMEAQWNARQRWLQMEFPDYQASLEDIRERARYVHSLILPYNGQSLKAQQLVAGSSKQVMLRNTHTLPIQLLGWGHSRQGPDGKLPKGDLVLAGQIPRRYLSRLRADSLITDFAAMRFLEASALIEQRPPTFDTVTLPSAARYIYYQPLGLDTLFYSRIHPLPPEHSPQQPVLDWVADTIAERPFYQVRGRRVIFEPGIHRIRELITFPAGYQIHVPPGTVFMLEQEGGILSRSPMHLLGSPELPILLRASGEQTHGLSVFDAPTTSIFRHVEFRGMQNLHLDGWELTGGVNFYQSSVQLDHCRFVDNRSEDALNIIRSEFRLRSCLFINIYSDAFDSDFSKGEIRNCVFQRTGNDGLDLSGSIVNIYDCRFETHGDKGISVGEESDAHIFDTTIQDAPIALAAKDQSLVFARNIRLIDCEQGFVAFQKKAEYGGANIIVETYRTERVRRLYSAGEGSRIQLSIGD